MRYRLTLGGLLFDTLNIVFLLLLSLATIYPFLYVLFSSVSDPFLLNEHFGLMLKPQGFTLKGYELTLKNPAIVSGYRNTIIYVVLGTTINMVMTSIGAYVLSRKRIRWTKYLMWVVVVTMFFGGGLIPFFLLIRNLGMLNRIWAMIVPGAISVWHLIVMRTSFQEIPESLSESARIDGANEWQILTRIILPVSKPVLAAMTLFYAVGHWNSWFNAAIFLRDRQRFPLQLILREMLILERETQTIAKTLPQIEDQTYLKLLRYTTIMVATLPILLFYPFLQKYFIKGVMIGSIKG